MESNGVALLVMDTFDDVNLAVVGPVGAQSPATSLGQQISSMNILKSTYSQGHSLSGPDSADASRHVLEIRNNQSIIKLEIAADADALAAFRRFILVVNSHVNGVALGGNEPCGLSSSLVDIVDKPVCRVTLLQRKIVS